MHVYYELSKYMKPYTYVGDRPYEAFTCIENELALPINILCEINYCHQKLFKVSTGRLIGTTTDAGFSSSGG